MVRQIGLEITQSITQSREGFRYKGANYNLDIASASDRLVQVANEKYVAGERESISADLEPGQEKEFARIEADDGKFILLLSTSATAHPTAEYNYYIDGESKKDENLSGSAPWATPPDQYRVRPRGFMIVDNFISLQVSETSAEREYDSVEGWLNAILLEER